jgi:hypothetical protein
MFIDLLAQGISLGVFLPKENLPQNGKWLFFYILLTAHLVTNSF